MSEVHEKCLVFGASGFWGSNKIIKTKIGNLQRYYD